MFDQTDEFKLNRNKSWKEKIAEGTIILAVFLTLLGLMLLALGI